MVHPAPHISIVIPIHNEAAILRQAIAQLLRQLANLQVRFEIVLSENGSTDGTRVLAQQLRDAHQTIFVVTAETANYGLGLKRGIESATGDYVICDEIDLLDTDFYRQALQILERNEADLVIGSKLALGASDERPWLRHVASLGYTTLLRTLLGFRGTDTHGLKAMHRERILPIVQSCRVDKDVFASELVIRAQRSQLRLVEIPTRIREKRPPSVNLYRRVPSVLVNLAKLFWSIRCAGNPGDAATRRSSAPPPKPVTGRGKGKGTRAEQAHE